MERLIVTGIHTTMAAIILCSYVWNDTPLRLGDLQFMSVLLTVLCLLYLLVGRRPLLRYTLLLCVTSVLTMLIAMIALVAAPHDAYVPALLAAGATGLIVYLVAEAKRTTH